MGQPIAYDAIALPLSYLGGLFPFYQQSWYTASVFFIAYKNLFQEKVRLFISAGGVSFAIVLMIILLGIYKGTQDRFVINILKNPADIFVVQRGIRDFFHGVSLIPDSAGQKIQQQTGVKEVVPMIVSKAIVEINGEKTDFVIYSFVLDSKLGAPWSIVAGTDRLKNGEIVIDEKFAKKNKFKVGDLIYPNGVKFKIAGLAKDASLTITSLAFIQLADARVFSQLPKTANYYAVAVNNPQEVEKVRDRIQEELPDLKVFTKAEFVNNNLAEIKEGYLPIVFAMMIIAFMVGLAVIALTIYTVTTDKSKEYGILKAIGIKNTQLYQVALYQSFISSILGYCLGVFLAFGAAFLLYSYLNVDTKIDTLNLIFVLVSSLAMSAIATVIPIKKIASIDPAEVFKS